MFRDIPSQIEGVIPEHQNVHYIYYNKIIIIIISSSSSSSSSSGGGGGGIYSGGIKKMTLVWLYNARVIMITITIAKYIKLYTIIMQPN